MKETRNGVTEVSEITQEQYKHITSDDMINYYRSIGWTEKVTRKHTEHGYNAVKLISTSPNKASILVREFSFK